MLMTRLLRAAALLVTMGVCVACTGCTNDASSAAAAGPTRSAASPTGSTAAGDVPPPPKVGECRNTPPRNLGFDDWVDPTPVVDCSRRHTLETVEIIKPAMKLTLPLVKQLTGSCNTPAAAAYLGDPGNLGLTRILYPAVYWPSPEQRAAGQSWVRCDVGVEATTFCCQPRAQLVPQTASLRHVVGAD